MDDDVKGMFEDLRRIIDEELRVQFAVGRFGAIETPSPDRIATVAGLIADEVARYLARRTPST